MELLATLNGKRRITMKIEKEFEKDLDDSCLSIQFMREAEKVIKKLHDKYESQIVEYRNLTGE